MRPEATTSRHMWLNSLRPHVTASFLCSVIPCSARLCPARLRPFHTVGRLRSSPTRKLVRYFLALEVPAFPPYDLLVAPDGEVYCV